MTTCQYYGCHIFSIFSLYFVFVTTKHGCYNILSVYTVIFPGLFYQNLSAYLLIFTSLYALNKFKYINKSACIVLNFMFIICLVNVFKYI